MFKKLLIILYIIIIGAAIYFAVDFFISRNNTDSSESIDSARERAKNISEQDNIQKKSEEDAEDTNMDDSADIEEPEGALSTSPEDAAYSITQTDCKNECDDYDGDKKEYCKNICGFTGSEPEEKDCDDLSGLQKDYCIRDKAVKDADIDQCESISDSGIRKQCNNRITEEMIDQIM